MLWSQDIIEHIARVADLSTLAVMWRLNRLWRSIVNRVMSQKWLKVGLSDYKALIASFGAKRLWHIEHMWRQERWCVLDANYDNLVSACPEACDRAREECRHIALLAADNDIIYLFNRYRDYIMAQDVKDYYHGVVNDYRAKISYDDPDTFDPFCGLKLTRAWSEYVVFILNNIVSRSGKYYDIMKQHNWETMKMLLCINLDNFPSTARILAKSIRDDSGPIYAKDIIKYAPKQAIKAIEKCENKILTDSFEISKAMVMGPGFLKYCSESAFRIYSLVITGLNHGTLVNPLTVYSAHVVIMGDDDSNIIISNTGKMASVLHGICHDTISTGAMEGLEFSFWKAKLLDLQYLRVGCNIYSVYKRTSCATCQHYLKQWMIKRRILPEASITHGHK